MRFPKNCGAKHMPHGCDQLRVRLRRQVLSETPHGLSERVPIIDHSRRCSRLDRISFRPYRSPRACDHAAFHSSNAWSRGTRVRDVARDSRFWNEPERVFLESRHQPTERRTVGNESRDASDPLSCDGHHLCFADSIAMLAFVVGKRHATRQCPWHNAPELYLQILGN